MLTAWVSDLKCSSLFQQTSNLVVKSLCGMQKLKKEEKETRRLDLRDTLICFFFKEDHVVLSLFVCFSYFSVSFFLLFLSKALSDEV